MCKRKTTIGVRQTEGWKEHQQRLGMDDQEMPQAFPNP